jgi:hypothetical protein
MKQFHGFMIDVYHYVAHDLHVFHEVINEHICLIHIHRLDTLTNEGFQDLSLLLYSPIYEYSQIIQVGSSSTAYKCISILIDELFTKKNISIPSTVEFTPKRYNQYILNMPEPEYIRLSREDFNIIFNSELVVLPSAFYAIGILVDKTFIYSEKFALYWEIAPTMNFTISRIRQKRIHYGYFVICACDGYPENTLYAPRTIPTIHGNDTLMENEYEIFHRKHLILTQNNIAIHANTLPMPEQYYFKLNHYREFRWKHAGMPFSEKIGKIMYASSPERSSKFIFKNQTHPGGDITQRMYFYENYENHPNVVAIRSGWMHPNFISSDEMMKYKYLLDMDGCGASTWDAIAWKMRSGSVIFSVEGIWNRWFSNRFLPGIHYIAIKEDFSDLMEKYQWCEENQDKCKEIVYNACMFFDIYRFQEVEEYFYETVFPKII